MRHASILAASGAATLLLAGCNAPATTDAAANSATAEPATPTGQVTREAVTPPAPPPGPAPVQQAAIQTQPGPKNATVTLNKVAVTGDVLTVQLTWQGTKNEGNQWIKVDQVSLVDDATAQRIGVLKDNAGKYLAAPMGGTENELRVGIDTAPTIVWFKFPAPPATSRTVSLNLPEVAPFDGVPVTR